MKEVVSNISLRLILHGVLFVFFILGTGGLVIDYFADPVKESNYSTFSKNKDDTGGEYETTDEYNYILDRNYNKNIFSPIWPVDPWPKNRKYRGISAYYKDKGYRTVIGVEHYALDIRAPFRTPVRAADDGKIEKAGYHQYRGWEVIINHINGYETFYGHMDKILLQEGDIVSQGQIIGLSGGGERSGGMSSGPHLHFEIRYRGYKKDPLYWLDLRWYPRDEIREDYLKLYNK